jgi:hypothetical protein
MHGHRLRDGRLRCEPTDSCSPAERLRKSGAMKNFSAITHAHVWVLNHQEALDF